MRQQIKHRISILVGLALIGLSVNGYAAEVSADKTPTTAASSESNGASEIHTINVTANGSFRFRYAGCDGCYYSKGLS